MQKIGMVLAILLLFGAGTWTPCAQVALGGVKTPDYILEVVQEDGLSLSLIGAVSEYSLWYPNWSRQEKKAYENGRWQVHLHMKPNPFSAELAEYEWILLHITVPESLEVVLDYATRLAMDFGDGRTVVSTEIVLTDDPSEKQVYSTVDGAIILEGMSSEIYGRARCGPYVAFVAYPRDSLRLKHSGVSHAEFQVTPTYLRLERRWAK